MTMLPQVQPSVVLLPTTKTQVNVPTSHVIPNLSAWTFLAPSSFPTVHAAVPQPVRGKFTSTSTTAAPILTNHGVFTQVVPIQSGGTAFYFNPLTTKLRTTTLPIPRSTTAPVNVPFLTFPTTVQSTIPPVTPTAVTVQGLAQLLIAANKDHLPEWKLEQYNGDPLQWHEWIGQLRSASTQPQTSSVDLNNVAGSSNPAFIPASIDVAQIKQATPPVRSFAVVNFGPGQNQIPPIGISSSPNILRPNSTPHTLAAFNTPFGMTPFFLPQPVNTTSNTVSSMIVPKVNPQSMTMLPQVQPSVVLLPTTKTQVNVPTSHVIPNLSAWTFLAPSSFPTVHAAVPQPVRGKFTSTSTTAAPILTNHGVFTQVVPIQCGRTNFYCNPLATKLRKTHLLIPRSTTAPVNVLFLTFPTTVQSTIPPATPTAVTVQGLAQQLIAANKDHLPELKLEQYNGDPLQWHEWIGQLRSAIDSAPLSNDVTLTYLKTLVTGKAKTAIAEFAYCGTM